MKTPTVADRRTSTAATHVGVVLALLLGLASCAPEAPQAADQPTIGFLRLVPSQDHDAFVKELSALGWRPGVDVRILPTDIDELYDSQQDVRDALDEWQRDGSSPDVVIAYSTPYARLIQDETDLPGLFVVNDPLAGGLISDMDRPDGQLTGVSWETPADRTLDLVSRALGGIDRIGYLAPDSDAAGTAHRDLVTSAAEQLGIDVVVAPFSGPEDAADAVSVVAEAEVDAVYLSSSNTTALALDELEQALDHERLPVIANVPFVHFATFTLAPDLTEMHKQLARQTARLLGGTDVAMVPAEHPRRFVATIDQTRARALGRDIDPSVLHEADLVR